MTFVERMVGAAKFSSSAYEDVEADRGATGQALAVVVLSSLAAGIGAGAGLCGLVFGTVASLVGWLVWAVLIYLIGARWLPEPGTQSDTGELMRTIGFATSPGILRVVGIVPFLTSIVFTVTALWMLATMVVGVRQALDYKSTWRALGVCLLGWIVQFAAFILLARLVPSHDRPGALRAAERLHGRLALAPVLRRVRRGADAHPHRLLADQDLRRARAVRHRRVAARGARA